MLSLIHFECLCSKVHSFSGTFMKICCWSFYASSLYSHMEESRTFSRLTTRGSSSATATKPGADYINANYINCETDKNLVAGKPFKQYIATQGCVSSTRADFWQIVWQEERCLIVMTTVVSPGQVLLSVRN